MAAVRFSAAGEVLYAYLSGEVDHDAAQSLRIQLDDALVSRTPQTLVLDFGGVALWTRPASADPGAAAQRPHPRHHPADPARARTAAPGAAAGRHPVHRCIQNGGMTHESGKHHKDPV